MPDPNTAVATPPSNDAPSQGTPDSGAAPGTPSPSTADTPFLKVSDRQVYKTQEEAVRAYSEASNRIAQLSPWEQLAKEGFTPEQVQQYLDDLARRIEAEKQTTAPAPDASQLTPEWKAHIEFLKTQGIFTTMDELKALQAQVTQLTQGQQGEHAARLEGARSNGESILNGLIKESGLQLDEADARNFADSIEDRIVRSSRDAKGNITPGSSEDRFIRGDAAERASIIKEHFNWFTKFGDVYAKRQTATFVDQKAAAQAASPRPLPTSTSPVPTPAKPGLGFKDRSLNDAVTAAMNAERERRGGGALL